MQRVHREASKSGRIREAAAEWNSKSRAVAARGGKMRDRRSGDVVGGELDAISISNETEKSTAQRQSGNDVRHRREVGLTTLTNLFCSLVHVLKSPS